MVQHLSFVGLHGKGTGEADNIACSLSLVQRQHMPHPRPPDCQIRHKQISLGAPARHSSSGCNHPGQVAWKQTYESSIEVSRCMQVDVDCPGDSQWVDAWSMYVCARY